MCVCGSGGDILMVNLWVLLSILPSKIPYFSSFVVFSLAFPAHSQRYMIMISKYNFTSTLNKLIGKINLSRGLSFAYRIVCLLIEWIAFSQLYCLLLLAMVKQISMCAMQTSVKSNFACPTIISFFLFEHVCGSCKFV